jgi:hypothetical protein
MLFVSIYVAAITAANLSVAAFGPAVTPINAFLLIGLDLSLRDKLHDRWAGRQLWPRMLAMIVGAGVISYALNPATGTIALASVVAFTVAGLVDAIVYQGLLGRPYLVRANGSNSAGALVDSLVFPTIAFGGFLPAIVALQFAAKVAGGFVWSLALRRFA